jgi:hypothetical protein
MTSAKNPSTHLNRCLYGPQTPCERFRRKEKNLLSLPEFKPPSVQLEASRYGDDAICASLSQPQNSRKYLQETFKCRLFVPLQI